MELNPYGLKVIISFMPWEVLFHDEFAAELEELPETVQNELIACSKML